MMKKMMAAFLVLIILTSNIVLADTPQASVENDSANTMVKIGLMKGYSNGDLGLDRKITRAEFATIIIRMLGYDKKPFTPSTNISFKDLNKKHWAYSSVRMAASLGYIKGYSDKAFKPSNNITYAEAIAIMVRVLGYSGDVKGKWPDNFIDKGEELGILKNLEVESGSQITRGAVSILVVNSLPVKVKK